MVFRLVRRYARSVYSFDVMFAITKRASGGPRWRFACAAALAFFFVPVASFGSSSYPSSFTCGTQKFTFYGNSFSYGSGGYCSDGPYYQNYYGNIFQCGSSGCRPVPYGSCSGSGTLECSSPSPSCSPAPGEVTNPSMSTKGSFCDPNTDCVSTGSQTCSHGVCFNNFVTNGQSCSPTASTVSASSGAPCPSGYTPLANGCECVSSSGNSYVSSLTAPTNSACNGGSSSSTPTLTPVAPVSSATSGAESVPGTSTYCPAGSGYAVSSSGSVTCYASTSVTNNNSYSLTPASQASNGSYYCPPGDSSIGSGSSMMCVGSGSSSGASSSTASGASASSPTASASSGQSYLSHISIPNVPYSGISTVSVGSIAAVSSSSSGYSCPQSLSFSVLSHTFHISFKPVCTVAGDVRPVVIGVFSMSSLFLLLR